MSRWIAQLKEKFSSRRFRESFATEHLNSTIALQLTVIREQRGLKQADLAKLAGTKQEGISRLESAEYGRWNLQTLRDLAYLLGCRLRVSFETFGSLLEEAEMVSRAMLQRPSFEEDPIFYPGTRSAAGTGSRSADPVEWVRRLIVPYLESPEPEPAQMASWLSGRDLPPVGDEEQPYLWLARALPANEPKYRHAMIEVVDKLLRQLQSGDPASSQGRHTVNLLRLAAELGEESFSLTLAARLNSIYGVISGGTSSWRRSELSAFRDAVIRHQTDDTRKDEWLAMIEQGRHPVFPGTARDAFRGMCYIPLRPNLESIAEGLKRLEATYWDELDYEEILDGVATRFSLDVQGKDRLFELSINKGWGTLLVTAWRKCFALDPQTLHAVADSTKNLGGARTMEGALKVMTAGA
jgi:transcriptional regulator with XRE-family HTH domain